MSVCRYACLELPGLVQTTACSQKILFTLEFLVTAVCASLSFECLHLGCPLSVSSPLCACESLVCRGATESTFVVYMWWAGCAPHSCDHTMCSVSGCVEKTHHFSPYQANSLNPFCLLILLLLSAVHILGACSYISIASCSCREFLPSIFSEACKPLW